MLVALRKVYSRPQLRKRCECQTILDACGATSRKLQSCIEADTHTFPPKNGPQCHSEC